MLARVDAAREDLSGPAVRRICQREYTVFGKPEFERLAGISVSHIYNLRASETYRRQRVRVQPARPRQIAIAERRQPDPQAQPGYLRVDTVHQGSRDGQAGLFPINAVDTVTQWEVVGCVETIAERHLLPVLEAMLHQFPFGLRGLTSLPNWKQYLKEGITAELLDRQARQSSDTEAAQRMQKAKLALLAKARAKR